MFNLLLIFCSLISTFAWAVDVPVEPAAIAETVNPTAQYLTEQFKLAVSSGLPLASEGIKEICNQISNLGIGLLIFHIICIGIGIGLVYPMIRLIKLVDTRDEATIIYMLSSMALGLISIFLFILGMTEINSDIKMIFAPTIWALEHLI